MTLRLSRRLFLFALSLLAVNACQSRQTNAPLVIGVIDYDQDEQIDRYTSFSRYLSSVLKAHVEIEPTFNERKALERIESQAWSLVFASPGVATIAIEDFQYIPLFSLQEEYTDLRSIFVVDNNNPIQELEQLNSETIALCQIGSTTGFYFPVYNLYGLNPAEVLLAPTPMTILEWIAQKKVAAGALSTKELNLYSPQFSQTEFRILYTDSHPVPNSSVLLAPTIERTYQDLIINAMSDAPPDIVRKAEYIPNISVPNYEYMISVVKRVRVIARNLGIAYE